MNRIFFRAFEPEDYFLINNWRQDEEILRSLGGNHYFVSLEREKQWVIDKSLNDNRNVYLAICLIETGQMIGYTSINNIDLRNAKCEWGGTIIGEKSMWGKGYASEAARLMLHYIFKQYPMNKCYGYCLEEHAVTHKMLLSLGFVYEGMARDDVYKNGQYKSKLQFSMLRSEYIDKYSDQVK